MTLGDCWRYLAENQKLHGGYLLRLGFGLGLLLAIQITVSSVVGREPLGVAAGHARVGNGQSQTLILANLGRCLGDCWPLRPSEAAGLGRWCWALRPLVGLAGGSPGSSPGKRPSRCGANPAGMAGGLAPLPGSGPPLVILALLSCLLRLMYFHAMSRFYLHAMSQYTGRV